MAFLMSACVHLSTQAVQGAAVVSVREAADGIELLFKDQCSERFDLVVFADAYRSLGRGMINPGCETEYQGYLGWRGIAPVYNQRCIQGYEERSGTGFADSDRRRLGVGT
jgi:2-polyprenyl-6-methoxyphenol hydroxylase-like FAD-dependent oxidoreductase